MTRIPISQGMVRGSVSTRMRISFHDWHGTPAANLVPRPRTRSIGLVSCLGCADSTVDSLLYYTTRRSVGHGHVNRTRIPLSQGCRFGAMAPWRRKWRHQKNHIVDGSISGVSACRFSSSWPADFPALATPYRLRLPRYCHRPHKESAHA